MGTDWDINSDQPEKDEPYDWRVPANDQQHVEETTAPGDLLIKPKDISLKPTFPPTQSGVQSGWSDWSFESAPDDGWYAFGDIEQE